LPPRRDAAEPVPDEGGASALHVRRAKNGSPSVHPMQGDEIRALRRLQREQGPPSPQLRLTVAQPRMQVDVIMGDRVWVEHECGASNAGGGLFEHLQPLSHHLEIDE